MTVSSEASAPITSSATPTSTPSRSGPRLMLSDKEYQRAYFGVTPQVALATGLPVYSPGSGIHAVGATSGIYYSFTPVWGLFGYARYERLVGDAKKSPIVKELGSANQYSAGIGLTYTFTFDR
jgi:MipA family protein